jgi:hypothetical protein
LLRHTTLKYEMKFWNTNVGTWWKNESVYLYVKYTFLPHMSIIWNPQYP